MRRVVVTGIGAVTPIGNNIDDFWVSLTEGKAVLPLLPDSILQNLKLNSAVSLRILILWISLKRPKLANMICILSMH